MKNQNRTKIYIILGPTSSGKTSLALELCKKFNGEIISADSRQVYKHMNIGTGKIPLGKKLNNTKIFGYDLATPDQYFSGYDFAKFALAKARSLLERGKTVFVVGGTGFYIDLFTGKIKPSNKKPDFELRSELGSLSLSELGERLASLNLKVYEKTDVKNKVRLIRAIEREVSEKNFEGLPYLNNVEFVYIGLMASREILYSRVDKWLDAIWKDGLIDEVKKLVGAGYYDSPRLSGLVYKSVLDFMDGKLSEEKALERAKFDLHAYVRRQQTYFKRNKNIRWFDITSDEATQNIYTLVSHE